MNRYLTALTYIALLAFGAGQGVLGAFFYNSGPPPLYAIAFDLLILATCLLGAWGMGHAAGGFAPAVGWFVAAFVLASSTHEGSVIIAANTGGEWFLFGGAVGAIIGLIVGFSLWSRREPPGGLPGRGDLRSPGPVNPPRS
jgi:hypothetical protein